MDHVIENDHKLPYMVMGKPIVIFEVIFETALSDLRRLGIPLLNVASYKLLPEIWKICLVVQKMVGKWLQMKGIVLI